MFNDKDLKDYAIMLERQGKSAILMAGVRTGVTPATSQSRIEQINPFADGTTESKMWLRGFYHGQSQLQSSATRIIADMEKLCRAMEI